MSNIVIIASLVYVTILFFVAFWAERLSAKGNVAWLKSPWIYTLSLSVYCTAWTFYGAVGYAARSGMEFVTIYLGPSLVMFGWWILLRKLVQVGRNQRVTSIADLLSSRFGKSSSLAALVTILAVVGTTPYIALQLQSVTLSFNVFAQTEGLAFSTPQGTSVAVWVAIGLAVFTILFGTRNLDIDERHHGVVTAIAVEAVVKLVALVAVGVFVVWGVTGGIGPTLDQIGASELSKTPVSVQRWISNTFLAGAAFLCLPRIFQVLVVENEDRAHLRVASWAFPLYLLMMSLFVVPIAVAGLSLMPENANPDLFVLTLPYSQGQNTLAVFSFLGGFSSATSMVIVASIALSTMVSNHIVMPLFLRFSNRGASVSGDVRDIILMARRLSIAGILTLGYGYYRLSGGGAALASIGLVSFAGVVQLLPALVGGIFWRGATKIGAIAGVSIGFVLWFYTLFLPSFGDWAVLAQIMEHGPFGIMALNPQSLFGVAAHDPLIHGLFWSLTVNALVFIIVSLSTEATPVERVQSATFVDAAITDLSRSWASGSAASEDLMVMSQRILGASEAKSLFQQAAEKQGLSAGLPEPTSEFLTTLERELAGSVGAATAHAMVGQIVGETSVTVEDLLAVADETAQIMEYSNQLEQQQQELKRTTQQLQEANDKLTRLSVQKDAFLSQISHELRTPMTSILAFSQILRGNSDVEGAEVDRYSGIIHDEAIRLTRLLDDLLDLSVLENGQVSLNLDTVDVSQIIKRAVSTVLAGQENANLEIKFDFSSEAMTLVTDADRLSQVFINLISNAQKYCDATHPVLTISTRVTATEIEVDFVDNGSGISGGEQHVVFEKFARLSEQKAGGAGLGLAICREILTRLGGSIVYVPDLKGAAFRVKLLRVGPSAL